MPSVFSGVVGVKTEPHHRGMKLGISLHAPDNWERQLAAGGVVGVKTEPHHRGMKLGVSLHAPDNWERQLAAGGAEGNRTPVRKPLDTTFSGCRVPIISFFPQRRHSGFEKKQPFFP